MSAVDEERQLALTLDELRVVAGYAAQSAHDVLRIFEEANPADAAPRAAIDAALAFANGGERGKALRDAAWAAMRAARRAGGTPAADAARAAMSAASAAYLHPLFDPHQVKHILGATAYAARAAERVAGDDRDVGAQHVEHAARRASPIVVEVLGRYPPAPQGGGRVGALLRELDARLRGRPRADQRGARSSAGQTPLPKLS